MREADDQPSVDVLVPHDPIVHYTIKSTVNGHLPTIAGTSRSRRQPSPRSRWIGLIRPPIYADFRGGVTCLASTQVLGMVKPCFRWFSGLCRHWRESLYASPRPAASRFLSPSF